MAAAPESERNMSAPSQPLDMTLVNHCQSVAMDPGSANGRYCCSKIFVNHRCFSGPYLNKGASPSCRRPSDPGNARWSSKR
ncbi:hypothetical protein INR49_005073 [Caranx melampygus]|nr:hypothetical protein INR49_005073 [Caranx melampygus]